MGRRDDENARGMPTPEEIARRAAEVRSTWTEATRRRRNAEARRAARAACRMMFDHRPYRPETD